MLRDDVGLWIDRNSNKKDKHESIIMCGIAGIISPHQEILRQFSPILSQSVKHRGPDSQGIHLEGPVSFIHRRLSIVDLTETGNQPMLSQCGQYLLVFNGEIYNFQDLKKELLSQGVRFRGTSDTEVLLESYIYWGVDCLNKFNGMFAFAIFDKKKNKIFFGRDRFGKKPLYYMTKSWGMVFSSEPQGFSLMPEFSSQFSPEGVACFMQLGYILAPYTLSKDIFKLEPGCWMEFDLSNYKTKIESYWRYEKEFEQKHSLKENHLLEELDSLLEAAIKRRLIADVPITSFLSGGLDSSLIVANTKKQCGYQLSAYTYSFPENESFDESSYAQTVADYCKIPLTKISNSMKPSDGITDALKWDPISDNSYLGMLGLSSGAGQKYKVCLTGDGADEIFAGYPTYKATRISRFANGTKTSSQLSSYFGKINSQKNEKLSWAFKAQQFLNGLSFPKNQRHVMWRQIFDRQYVEQFVLENIEKNKMEQFWHLSKIEELYKKSAHLGWLDQALYVDAYTWLSDNILPKLDRSSMAYGVELRSPFLDDRFVDFVAKLPRDMKMKGFQGKYLLKKLAGQHLPKEIVYRKKSGFNYAYKASMRERKENEFQQRTREIMSQLLKDNHERV